jgi:PadR family transcriptional regulator AphA
MSLPHVLLGLLTEAPRTGYDLARVLSIEIEPVWRAEYSQIYPELARLRRAGFVLLRVLGPRKGPRRNLYRITAAGRRELRRWLAEPASPPRVKDEGLARIAFFDVLPAAERREALLGQERAVAEEIRRLESSPSPPGSRGVARRGAIDRLEATRRWLRAAASEKTGAPPSSFAKKK